MKAIFVGNAPHIRAKARLLFSGKDIFPRRISNRDLAAEPGIGNPMRLPDHKFTSGARVNMLWHLKSLLEFGEDLSQYDFIFEFGGGVGYLADMVFRLGFAGEYFLYDVPTMSRIQKWYLGQLDRDAHAHCVNDLSDVRLPVNENVAFVGLMSFTEIPLKEREKVEPFIFSCELIFIAFATQYSGIDNAKYIAHLAERLQLEGYETQIKDIDPWRKGKKYFVAKRKV